jgi:hypothetical protein
METTDIKAYKFYKEAFRDIQEWFDLLKYIKEHSPKTPPPSFEAFLKARTEEFKWSLKL